MSSARSIGALLLALLGLAGKASAGYDDYYVADYYDYYEDPPEECVEGDDGVSRASGFVCDLVVSGEDNILEDRYAGGITGLYRYTGECQNSRPAYMREDKPGQKTGMWLLYSSYWLDWDFCNTTTVDDHCLTGYGGDGHGEARPEDVLDGDWYVLGAFVEAETRNNEFVKVPKLSVKCAANDQGTVPRPVHPASTRPDQDKMSLLTPEPWRG